MPSREHRYIAIIVDMVKSRLLPRPKRTTAQKKFQSLVSTLNTKYQPSLASKFIITLGDEFQGLLNTGTVIPDLLWRLEKDFSATELRVGIGVGPLHTPMQEFAINIDGPALHMAREAIDAAKKANARGGVFVGFDQLDDILTGVARLLWFHRSRWTRSQWGVVELLRSGMMQSEIAERFSVTRQVVSKHFLAAGVAHYLSGEKALLSIFRQYVDPSLGLERIGDPLAH